MFAKQQNIIYLCINYLLIKEYFMKKCVFLVMLMALGITHTGAQSAGFLLDGLNWSYRGQYVHEEYKIDGSRTVNGKDYKQLTIIRGGYDSGTRGIDNPMRLSPSYWDYVRDTIGIREDGGRIYINKDEYISLLTEEHIWFSVVDGEPLPYETTADGELVLYDFNKKEGEVYLQTADGTTLEVTKTHTLKTEDGVTRRCLTLSNGYEIIEGVGCINSPGMLLFWLNMKLDFKDFGVITRFWLDTEDGNSMTILAQDFDAIYKKRNGHPSILQQGRRWVYDYDNGQVKGTLTYYMEGDTLNQGYKGYKIHMRMVDKENAQIVKSCYAGALFEKLGKVTFLAPNKDNDVPLYCFDYKIRDIRPISYSLMVINTDDIKVGDINYHRVQLVNKRDVVPLEKDSLYYWVEGIGSSRGLLEYNAGALFDSINFVACYDGEKCIFANDDFYKDSGQPSKFNEYINIGELWYQITLAEKKAIVSYNSTCLDSLVIPSSLNLWDVDCNVVGISDYAFEGCSNLKTITLPQNLVSIGEYAFKGCGLTEVIIPDSVKSIGAAAFIECSDLVSVSFPNSLSSIGQNAFANCTSLQSVILPDGLKTINSTFRRCSSLKMVDLPAALTEIKGDAFKFCANLVDVYSRAMTPPQAEDIGIFKGVSSEATLHVPNDALQAYKNAETWRKFKYIVPIEETNGIMAHKYEFVRQRIFDLQGRAVKGTPRHGVYVKDGRKVIR